MVAFVISYPTASFIIYCLLEKLISFVAKRTKTKVSIRKTKNDNKYFVIFFFEYNKSQIAIMMNAVIMLAREKVKTINTAMKNRYILLIAFLLTR